MAAKRIGLHEVRTRVICHLPVNDGQEEKAFFQVLDYFKAQREQEVGVEGFTHSIHRPAVFRGYWWSAELQDWIADRIVLCIVDYHLDFGDKRLSGIVKEIKQVIRKWYRYYGRPQDEVWVVAQQIVRQD